MTTASASAAALRPGGTAGSPSAAGFMHEVSPPTSAASSDQALVHDQSLRLPGSQRDGASTGESPRAHDAPQTFSHQCTHTHTHPPTHLPTQPRF